MNQALALIGLDEFKRYYNKTGDGDDDFLRQLIRAASRLFQNKTNRALCYQEHTEYHDGFHATEIWLDQFPIQSDNNTIAVYDDPGRNYTNTYKLNAEDIVLDETAQQMGVVRLEGDTVGKGTANIKVVYTAGYSEFLVQTNLNDYIDFNDGINDYSVQLDAGIYTAATLTTEIQSKMNTTASSDTYAVTYDTNSQRFTFSSDGSTFIINWISGDNEYKNAAGLLGFEKDGNSSGALVYTSDFVRAGMPEDIRLAIMVWVEKVYNDSKVGEGRAGLKSRDNPKAMTNITYLTAAMPDLVQATIAQYRRVNI